MTWSLRAWLTGERTTDMGCPSLGWAEAVRLFVVKCERGSVVLELWSTGKGDSEDSVVPDTSIIPGPVKQIFCGVTSGRTSHLLFFFPCPSCLNHHSLFGFLWSPWGSCHCMHSMVSMPGKLYNLKKYHKVHVKFAILSIHVSAHISCIKHIYTIVQPVFRTFLTCRPETLYPLNSNLCLLPLSP